MVSELSENNRQGFLDLGKVATVFIIFGFISLLTSWIYSIETKKVVNKIFKPYENQVSAEIGPINVKRYNEVYNISIGANITSQSWSHIEGQVLNRNKQYLFSFGKEISYYSVHNSDKISTELENDYSINVTFPQPGAYYLIFSTEGNNIPSDVSIKVSKMLGSSLPHLWFGILTLIIGIILNEVRNRTVMNVLDKLEP